MSEGKSTYKLTIKFIAGVLLLPFCYGSGKSFWSLMVSFEKYGLSRPLEFFTAGLIFYFILHIILYKPITTYVFGHEMTHAIWTWLFLGKVSNIKAARDGGQVSVSKNNFLIELAPYFFPFYSFLLIGIYYGVDIFWPKVSDYRVIFYFLVGASWCFHLMLTLHFLKEEQSDIKKNGYFFSMVIIFLVNLQCIVFIISIINGGLGNYIDFNKHLWGLSAGLYKDCYSFLYSTIFGKKGFSGR